MIELIKIVKVILMETENKKKGTKVAKKTSNASKRSANYKRNNANKKRVTPKKNTGTKTTTATSKKNNSVKKVENKKSEILDKTFIFSSEEVDNLNEVVKNLEEEKVVTKEKVIERSKINKYVIICLSILIGLVILYAVTYVISYEHKEKINSQTLNSDIYKKITKDRKNDKQEENKSEEEPSSKEKYEHIKTLTLKQFEQKILNKEKMTILIFNQTCYSCVVLEPKIEEALASQNKNIYELNIYEMSNEEINRFRTYYNFKSTPTFFKVENGIVVNDLVGKTNEDVVINWLKDNV